MSRGASTSTRLKEAAISDLRCDEHLELQKLESFLAIVAKSSAHKDPYMFSFKLCFLKTALLRSSGNSKAQLPPSAMLTWIRIDREPFDPTLKIDDEVVQSDYPLVILAGGRPNKRTRSQDGD